MRKKKEQKSKLSILKQLTKSIGGVEEAVVQLPLITIIGNESINIENFLTIIEYGAECIRLKTKQGQIIIIGKNLMARSMTQEEISINGKIESVEFAK